VNCKVGNVRNLVKKLYVKYGNLYLIILFNCWTLNEKVLRRIFYVKHIFTLVDETAI